MHPRVQSPESRNQSPGAGRLAPSRHAPPEAKPMHPGAVAWAQRARGPQTRWGARVRRPQNTGRPRNAARAASTKRHARQLKWLTRPPAGAPGPMPHRLQQGSGGGTAQLMPSATCSRPQSPSREGCASPTQQGPAPPAAREQQTRQTQKSSLHTGEQAAKQRPGVGGAERKGPP